MNEAGTVIYPGTIRFERVFAVSPARLWEYLTVPAFLEGWLAKAQLDLCVGGGVELRFDVDAVPERKHDSVVIRGVISRCVPPHLLSYSWDESAVTFELKAHGQGQTQLVLTQSGLTGSLVPICNAGWHTHLEILRARLGNKKPEAFAPLFRKMFEYYKLQPPEPVQKERRKLVSEGLRSDRRRLPRGSDFV